MKMRLVAGVAALALLGGCEAKVDKDSGNDAAAATNVQGSAEGKAEEGKIALKAPGFDLSINIPKEMAEEAKADQDSDLLYPGAAIAGIYIAAGSGGGKGEVELRFTTPDSPDKVVAWYRDPARTPKFSIGEPQRSGSEVRLEGRQKEEGQSFKLRLGPGSGGGTDGRLTVRDKG